MNKKEQKDRKPGYQAPRMTLHHLEICQNIMGEASMDSDFEDGGEL